MTVDELCAVLAERGVSEQALAALRDLQAQMDAARFGGGTVAAADALRHRVVQVAQGLESTARKGTR